MAEFNLNEIFRQVWGYTEPPFPEIVFNRAFKKGNYKEKGDFPKFKGGEIPNYRDAGDFNINTWNKDVVTIVNDPLYAKNANGKDVFLPIWLWEDGEKDKYLLPNTVMSMSCKKNIITTPLINHDGTVKEQISIDDWVINVRGVIVSSSNSYPHEEVQKLKFWEKSVSLNIKNAKTGLFVGNVEKIIIESLSLPEVRGFENTQPYEMKLVSDKTFDLYIKSNVL